MKDAGFLSYLALVALTAGSMMGFAMQALLIKGGPFHKLTMWACCLVFVPINAAMVWVCL